MIFLPACLVTHANSSTESFLHSSDDSFLHGHSQQTSEESARYGDQSYTIENASFASTGSFHLPSLADNAQTCPQPNLSETEARPLSNEGFFAEDQAQPTWHDEAAFQKASVSAPVKDASSDSEFAIPHQRVGEASTSGRGRSGSLQQQQQHRRVGQRHSRPQEDATNPSAFSPLANLVARTPGDNSMYHTREVSTLSSSASESVDSTSSLTKQSMHDDGRPKRPLNAFMIYSRARRSAILKERTDLKSREIAGALADEWRNLEKVIFRCFLSITKLSCHTELCHTLYRPKKTSTRKWPEL